MVLMTGTSVTLCHTSLTGLCSRRSIHFPARISSLVALQKLIPSDSVRIICPQVRRELDKFDSWRVLVIFVPEHVDQLP